MKKNKISKNWIRKQHRDIYVRSSKIHGYRSRSAFKLIEIDNKFRLFLNKKTLLDLGSSPGGWTQIATKKIINGKILSVDLKKMDPITNSKFILGNFLMQEVKNEILDYFDKNQRHHKQMEIYRVRRSEPRALVLVANSQNNPTCIHLPARINFELKVRGPCSVLVSAGDLD